jgi:hypothetical protein
MLFDVFSERFRLSGGGLDAFPEAGVGATHGFDLQVAKWQRMAPPAQF